MMPPTQGRCRGEAPYANVIIALGPTRAMRSRMSSKLSLAVVRAPTRGIRTASPRPTLCVQVKGAQIMKHIAILSLLAAMLSGCYYYGDGYRHEYRGYYDGHGYY